jgi:hypothetical protein
MTGKIVNFVTGLLPKKKNGGYYLQLEDETTETKAKAEKNTAETSNGAKPAQAIVTEAATPAPTIVVEKAAPKSKTKAKAAKTESGQNGKAPKAESVKPAPKPAAVTPALPAETAFASKYLVPTSTSGRRRPGPSMNPFMDMARQAKTPNK